MKNVATAGIFTLFLVIFQPLTLYAQNSPDIPVYHEKLDHIQQSIVNIKENLKDNRSNRGNTLTQLRQLESKISHNARALKKNELEIKSVSKRIKQLNKNLKLLAKKLDKQRSILGEQIRAAYALGAQQNIKMLLNQQNPSELGRTQAYFAYFNKARKKEIEQFIQSTKSQQQQQHELSGKLLDQKKALATRKEQKQLLEEQRLRRSQLLLQLNEKINNQEQTLSELETSRTKIEDLLRSLGQLLADTPAAPSDRKPFKQQKGHLPWPIKGPFLARYGQSRNQGDLKWKGILIGSPYGVPVRAITHGRVAFSDWLQGYGFIIIIDHGDGYMSLYGHNESLLKQAGDWVAAGDVIATTGDSGGQPNPGLYFEIRSRGKPVDPLPWCSQKSVHKAAR